MKKLCRRLAILLALTVFVGDLSAQPRRDSRAGRSGSSGQPTWIMDYDQGRELARKTGKPLMVVFRCVP